MIKPNNWVEEDREEIVSAVIDGMISEMTLERMRQIVWDHLYEDLVWQKWADIWMEVEQYAPEIYERFTLKGDPSY
jgi:hypothetical protein